MLRRTFRLACEIAVFSLAAYAFFALPLRQKTPWQHVRAILSSPPAHEAAAELKFAFDKVKAEIGR